MATGLGIDVGTESIKVVQVRISGAVVTVTGAVKIPRPEPVHAEGEGAEAPAADTREFVPHNLGDELRRANLSRMGTVGVSGRDVILKYLLTPPMPPQKLKLYTDMEIGGKVGAKATDNIYDFRTITTPGARNDNIIMAGVCKNEFVYKVHTAMRAAKIDAMRITPACMGLINAYLRTQTPPPNETVVLVDVGHELMEIAILEEKNVYFGRSAPGGGKKFTLALDKILKMGIDKATDFKFTRAKLYPEGEKIPSKQELAFQAALKEGADNIAGAIRSSVTFCRTQTKMTKLDYHRVILSGGGARLKGLREYLEKKIGKPVQMLDLYNQLDLRKLDAASARCFEGESPDMTVALGLAIVDADPQSFHFSLIPEKILRRRTFWKKTVWGLAAAVVLALGVVIPYNNASSAAAVQADRAAQFKSLEGEAKEKRDSFRAKIAENQSLARKVDYYARQTRMDRVYLDLFSALRRETPAFTEITFFGPANDAPAGNNGTVDAGSGEVIRDLVVRGSYDTDTYKGTQFNDAFETLRKKLLDIPGVTNVTLPDRAVEEKSKLEKVFEIDITLQDPSKPLQVINKQSASATPPAPGAPPSPPSPSVAQKGE